MAPKKQDNNNKEKDTLDVLCDEFKKDGKLYGQRAGDEILAQEIITTSSFIFDQTIGGGFRDGSWTRFYADPECGKTSIALVWGKNWQQKFKDQNGFVLYFNAEGRINKDLIDRSGIDTSRDKFRIIDANNYDAIYTMTERAILDNKENRKYFVIVDSTDACERDIDKEKNIGEAEKIAGGAAIASAAGRRLSLLFNIAGHHLFLSSQVRDKMNTQNPRAGGGKSASGGNAPKFYSSLIGEIKKPWTDRYLFENPSDTKSKIIGRLCEIKLEKTYNESTGSIVLYPVKYGMKGGVWRAYEAFMVGQSSGLISVSKSWYEIESSIYEDMKSKGIDVPQKFQEKLARQVFDGNPDLVKYVLDKATILSPV